jgi:hypothetical protein
MAEVTTEIFVLVVQEPNLVEITYFQVDFVSQHFIDFKFYTDPMVSINSTLALHRIYGEEMTHGVYNAHKHGMLEIILRGGGESVLSNSFQSIFLIYTLNNSSNIDHYFVCQYHKIMSRNKKSK